MTRRKFIRLMGTGLTAAALPSAGGAAQQTVQGPNSERPNIVIILADDMGYSDLGCYGSEIRTPNLDGMASEGVRFTQFYCAARCCPSRASLLTGLYPHQAGVGKMVTRANQDPTPGPYQGYLNDRCVTIAEVLKQAGYRTYMSGKWHVGERPEHWPRKRGFERYFGLISGASSYFELKSLPGRERIMALDDERYTPTPGDFYMTDAFTDHAVEFLQGHGDSEQPFFLYLAYTAPHWPLHALPEDKARYTGKYMMGWDKLREQRYKKMVELGIIDPKWALSPRDEEAPPWESVEDKEHWDLRMAAYAAMVDRLDQGVGRVLEQLGKMGAAENTLVVFLVDNGGCHERINKRTFHTPGAEPGTPESYIGYEYPWANASNTPFRLFKHWIHEGGISTPFIARWPKVIKQHGELTDQVGHIIDLMPTCVELADAEYPKALNGKPITPTEGKSLLPVFRGETREPHEALYWEHFNNRGIRKGKWKLVATKAGEWELYDMEQDRTELNNLVESHVDKAEELYETWEAWARRVGV